jgi:hypothetical protein
MEEVGQGGLLRDAYRRGDSLRPHPVAHHDLHEGTKFRIDATFRMGDHWTSEPRKSKGD